VVNVVLPDPMFPAMAMCIILASFNVQNSSNSIGIETGFSTGIPHAMNPALLK
jgi:hypothetical protein